MSSMTPEKLQQLLEAALLSYGKTMSVDKLQQLFDEDQKPTITEIKEALAVISEACTSRGVELKEVASGYRFQAKQEFAPWIGRLWEEKAPRYSRALLETLALIAYRQPITRSEIEDVRGVSVSSHIIKTLLEREWIRVVGHRDVPGRPALYATTREFLDYFDLKSLEELPPLSEIRDLDKINAELELSEHSDESRSESIEDSDESPEKVLEQGTEETDDSVNESHGESLPDDHATLEEAMADNLTDEEIAEEVSLEMGDSEASESVFDDSIEPEHFAEESQLKDSNYDEFETQESDSELIDEVSEEANVSDEEPSSESDDEDDVTKNSSSVEVD